MGSVRKKETAWPGIILDVNLLRRGLSAGGYGRDKCDDVVGDGVKADRTD